MVKNPYIIIQARMGSQRLPGKVMMKIGGKPIIQILVERLKTSGIPVMVATSVSPKDDVLADFVESIGTKVFRGSEPSVLERFYFAAQTVNADVIIRATGDDPLMDGSLVRNAYEAYLSNNDERCYLSIGLSKTYPLGISASFFSFSLLEEAYNKATLPGEIEHIVPYFFNNVPGDILVKSFSGNMDKFSYRLTVDTPEDFELHRVLIERFHCDRMSIEEIVNVLDQNPDIARINETIVQKKWNEQ